MTSSKLQLFTQTLAKQFQVSPETLRDSFYPAQESDLPEILAFRQRHLGSGIQWDDEKYFRWRYSFSNQTSSHPRTQNRVWIFRLNGSLLGILGAIHVPLQIGEHSISALHPLDVLVDESIEGLGVGAWMQFVFNSLTDAMLVIGANEKSTSIVKRIFHRMPDRQVWKLSVSSFPLIYRRLPITFLAKPLSLAIDLSQNVLRLLRRAAISASKLEIREIEQFDSSLNPLVNSWKGKANIRLRTHDYLNWRFFENPNMTYEAIGLYEGNVCVGYAVFHSSNRGDANYLFLDDFGWTLADTSEELLFSLFAALRSHAKRLSIDIIILQSYGSFANRSLSRFGFIERPEPLLFSISCNRSEFESTMYNADLWFVTGADAHGGGR